MEPINPIKVVVMGQSLASGLFTSFEDQTSGGRDQLIDNFMSRAEVPVEVFDTSVPATSLLRRYRNRRSWWNEVADVPGRSLEAAMSAHDRTDVVLWSQGETDAEDADLDADAYERALRATFTHLHRAYRCLIICNFIGRRRGGHDQSTQTVLRVQNRVVSSLPFVFAGAEQYHVDLADDVHPNDAGFRTIGALSGQAIAAACLALDDPYPEVRRVEATHNVAVFHLGASRGWAIGGRRVTRPVALSPKCGESQFSVVDRAGRRLESREIYLDPATNEVFVVLDRDIESIAAELTAYVGYGTADALRLSQLVTEAPPLGRPLRRGGMAIDVRTAKAA